MPSDTFVHDTYVTMQWTPAMQLVVLGWLGVLGTTFGSFMNVVVYRLPRGMNLSVPGSHCPACNHAIRWYDNLPVVGWLKLRGRCRDCGIAISARYPLVEAAVGCVFLGLAWVDLFQGSLSSDSAIAPAVWATFAMHALLLCTLLCAALIKYDAQPLPLRLFWPAIALAIGVSIVWPAAFRLPLAWYPGDRFAHLEGAPLGWPESLGGLVAGFVIGGILTVLIRSTRAVGLFGNPTAELVTLGCCLGWQATMWASLCVLLGIGLASRNMRWAVCAIVFAAASWIAYVHSSADLSGRMATTNLSELYSPDSVQVDSRLESTQANSRQINSWRDSPFTARAKRSLVASICSKPTGPRCSSTAGCSRASKNCGCAIGPRCRFHPAASTPWC